MPIVGERYQVVIERRARDQLDVQPGDRAVEIVDGDRLIITFLPGRHRRSLRGRLRGAGRVEDFASYRDSDALADQLAAEVAEGPVAEGPVVEDRVEEDG